MNQIVNILVLNVMVGALISKAKFVLCDGGGDMVKVLQKIAKILTS